MNDNNDNKNTVSPFETDAHRIAMHDASLKIARGAVAKIPVYPLVAHQGAITNEAFVVLSPKELRDMAARATELEKTTKIENPCIIIRNIEVRLLGSDSFHLSSLDIANPENMSIT